MVAERRRPTAVGRVILERLEELSLSMAEIERRTPLTKNTVSNAIYGPRQPQRKTIEILASALELPVEALTRPGLAPARGVRFPTFGSWLLRWSNVSVWIGLLGAGLTALFLLRGPSLGGASPAVEVIHFAVILLLLARLPRAGVSPRAREDAALSLRLAVLGAGDLRRYWGAAWSCWLLLYLGLTAGALLGILPSPEATPPLATRWLVVALNLVQNGATVMLLLSYEVVARPTLEEDLTRKQVLPTEAWLALVLLVTLLEGAAVWLAVSWPVQQWFGWLSGFAQGTALALVVGRLDSKYIEAPAPVIALLYVYAAIQGAWPVFQSHHDLLVVLTFLALVLKCLLFFFMAWLFESRVLLFYLERVRQLDVEVREDRLEFLRRIQPGR